MPQYPATLTDILDPGMMFNPNVLRAVKAFARAKPWQGTTDERKAKYLTLNTDLAAACGVEAPVLRFHGVEQNRVSGGGCYNRDTHEIIVAFRLSFLTYLQLFATHRGLSERQILRWSINLFKRCFPRSFAGCRWEPRSGKLVRDFAAAT